LDNQVLDFITLIYPRLTDKQMHLILNSFDENQRANVYQLVNILSKDGFPQTNLFLNCFLSKIGYVPNGGNKMKAINFNLHKESEIPNLIEFLAIPRPDGQQQVINILHFPAAGQHQLVQKILESIQQVTILIHYAHLMQSITPPKYTIHQCEFL
jgi:hypothetical protein